VKKLGDHRYRQHQHQISLEGHHLKSKSTCHVHVVTQQTLSFVTTTTTISLSLVTSVSLAAVTGLTVALSETSLLVVALGKMLKGHVLQLLQLPPLRVLLSTTTLITYRCLLPQCWFPSQPVRVFRYTLVVAVMGRATVVVVVVLWVGVLLLC
jgi:hypothetical protein